MELLPRLVPLVMGEEYRHRRYGPTLSVTRSPLLFSVFPSPPLRTATDANTLLTHAYCCHFQSYSSSAYSLSISSKQPSRSAPPQRPTLLSPRPQSPPRPRLHLAQNRASIERRRRRRRRQYGVAASRAYYLLMCVFHRHHLTLYPPK
jgi:hypothetical protein